MEPPSDVITFTYDCTAKERAEGQALTAATVKGAKSQKNKVKSTGGLAGWLLFVAVAVVLMVWLKSRQPRSGRKPALRGVPAQIIEDSEPYPELLMASGAIMIGGVVFLFTGIALGVILNRRIMGRRNGSVQMSILPDGLMESREGVSTTTMWQSFRGAEVGSNVLILRSGDLQSVVIPKRLLGNEADVVRVFEMLKAKTTKTALPGDSAFPVIQP